AARGGARTPREMNTVMAAAVKPEYPVVDRNPPFTKTVDNFNTLDYLRLLIITGVSVTVGYLSGTPSIFSFSSDQTQRPRPVHGDWRPHRRLGRLYVRLPYPNSAGRLKGFFPNDDEVARYK
ncbi:unnamed protein product, partial [Musa hybrid cultivar]